MLDFKTKVIIFVVSVILLIFIGAIIDYRRDKKQSPCFDQYGNAHYSNCGPPLMFLGSIIILLILSML